MHASIIVNCNTKKTKLRSSMVLGCEEHENVTDGVMQLSTELK